MLGQLLGRPVHGYQIAKVASDMMGPWQKVSLGSLYPLLSKLERQGYIRAVEELPGPARGNRPTKVYELTEGGRMRLHQLLLDTSLSPGDYQRIFRLKAPLLGVLEPRERLHVVNHYINYCETAVLYMRSEARDFVAAAAAGYVEDDELLEATLDVMEHTAQMWQAEADWANRLRERVVARIESAEGPVARKGGGAGDE